MPIIINKRFGLGIPTADLMAKMDASIQEIFNGNVHNTVCSKPASNDLAGEIVFFCVWLRIRILGAGAGFEPATFRL